MQRGDLLAQVGEFALEAVDARRFDGGRGRWCGFRLPRRRGHRDDRARGLLVEVLAQAVRVALLLLAGTTRLARDVAALDQRVQRGVHLVAVERVEPLDALAQLTRG